MLPEVTWTISGATILVVLGWVLTGGFQTFKLGRALERMLADQQQLRKDVDALVTSASAGRKEVDAAIAAQAGAVALQKDMAADFRQLVAERYATKETVETLERRLTANQDRILDRLDQISERLERLGGDLVNALASARRT